MVITTKFDIGQHVYTIQPFSQDTIVMCEICEGSGNVEITVQGFTGDVNCPACYGRGEKREKGKDDWSVVQPFPILAMNVTKDKLLYFVYGSFFTDNNMFLTEEEAINECKKRNYEAVPSNDEGEE